jgi:4-amino-4-deoxychorismate lyase
MILVNGVAADSVAVSDRGLAYGDGVFRTLLAAGGRPRWWHRQYRKLQRDCAVLDIACPAPDTLREEVERVAAGRGNVAVKIIVTRGSAERGYAPPRRVAPTRIVMGGRAPDYPGEHRSFGVRVRWCSTRLARQPRLAGIKHLNRLENVIARSEWSDETIAEGLMLDTEGEVIGGTMSNLFIVEAGGLVTPRLARCGVAGVTREIVMDAAGRRGIGCREDTVTQQRLLNAEEVFLVNSLIGVWAVRSCAERLWTPGRLSARAREWLDEDEEC